MEAFEADRGGEEGWVGDVAAAGHSGQLACEGHGVTFDGDVDVEPGALEEEVAERAADEEERKGVALGDGEQAIEEVACRGREGSLEFSNEIRVSHNSPAYSRVLP